jgi:hypothetical protein
MWILADWLFTNNKKGPYTYYRCNSRYKDLTEGDCGSRQVESSKLDNAIWNWVSALMQDPELMSQAYESYHVKNENNQSAILERIESISEVLTSLRSRHSRLCDLYELSEIDRDELIDGRNDLQNKID